MGKKRQQNSSIKTKIMKLMIVIMFRMKTEKLRKLHEKLFDFTKNGFIT